MELISWEYRKFYYTGGEGVKITYRIFGNSENIINTGIRGSFNNRKIFKNYESNLKIDNGRYYVCVLRTGLFVECEFKIFAKLLNNQTIWLDIPNILNPRFKKLTLLLQNATQAD